MQGRLEWMLISSKERNRCQEKAQEPQGPSELAVVYHFGIPRLERSGTRHQ